MRGVRWSTVAALLTCCTANATPYFISPGGLDTNSGTSLSSPWKTFSRAIAVLKPGDELVLADGTYQNLTTGLLDIDCTAGAQSGTPAQPITVRALNERLAWLDASSGVRALHITGCANWEVRGLRLSGGDVVNPASWYVVQVDSTADITLRRLLLSNSNRYVNGNLIEVARSQGTLVEECELYWFSRSGISFSQTDGGTVRRSYLNSRGFSDIDGGYACCDATRGDVGVVAWDQATGLLLENVVSEGQGAGLSITSFKGVSDVRVEGCISLNEGLAVVVDNQPTDGGMPATGVTLSNLVAVGPTNVGVEFRSTREGRCTNCSILGQGTGPLGGLRAVRSTGVDYGSASTLLENVLITQVPRGIGVTVASQSSWVARGINVFGADAGFSPWPGNFTATTSLEPLLGGCLAWLPAGSPMKGLSADGGDVGANVLWRSVGGVLTCEPLWDAQSGAFPCGATVAGVNDVPGSSCFDLNQRLSIGTASCPFPAGYGTLCGRTDGGLGDAGVEPSSARVARVGCGCSVDALIQLWASALAVRFARRRR